MNNESKSTGHPGDLLHLWYDLVSHATEAYQPWAGATMSPEVLRQSRSNLYKAWGDSWERFLRSSSFLDNNRQYMTGTLEMKKQVREFFNWLHHEMQLASADDVDQIMATLRRLGEDLREQLEEIHSRLDDFGARLHAGPTQEAPAGKGRDEDVSPPERGNGGRPASLARHTRRVR